MGQLGPCSKYHPQNLRWVSPEGPYDILAPFASGVFCGSRGPRRIQEDGTNLVTRGVPGWTSSGVTRRCRESHLASPRVPGQSLWGHPGVQELYLIWRPPECQDRVAGVTLGSRNLYLIWRPPGWCHPGVQESASPRGVIQGARILAGATLLPLGCARLSAHRCGPGPARARLAARAADRGPCVLDRVAETFIPPSTGKAGREAGGHAGRQGQGRHARCHKVRGRARLDLQTCICLLRCTCGLPAGRCCGCPASVPVACDLTASLPA